MGCRVDEGLRRHRSFHRLAEWILTEVGDAFSHPAAQRKFIRLLDLLREQSDVEIVPSTSDLFRRGTEFFSARPDKEWSLTDCISFVAMNERDITDALTSITISSRLDFEFC
jgi:predicted nucleic acid-binding protein